MEVDLCLIRKVIIMMRRLLSSDRRRWYCTLALGRNLASASLVVS